MAESKIAEVLDIKDIEEVARRLKNKEVGIIPTDTIYGLAGIVDADVSSRLYEIKKREGSKRFIVLMTLQDVKTSFLKLPKDIEKRWPAPFTAILETAGNDTVAVRVPDDSFLEKVMNLSGPIYSTSANISGSESLNDFTSIYKVFKDKVDFIVRTDVYNKNISSTLIDVTKKPYRILRQGTYRF